MKQMAEIQDLYNDIDTVTDYDSGGTDDQPLSPEDEFLINCTEIEITRIDLEMARLHAEMARWHARYSDAYRALLYAEMEYKRECSRLFLIHNEVPNAAGKAPSVELVKARVFNDPDEYAANSKLVDAKIEHERLQGICRVVAKKADMIQGINQRVNAELRANPALSSAM